MNDELIYTSSDFDLSKKNIQVLNKMYTNPTSHEVILEDSCYRRLLLPASFQTIYYYTSSWGKEFTKKSHHLTGTFSFANTKGRCSAEVSPFFTVTNGELWIDFAIASSGNYRVTFLLHPDNLELSIHDIDDGFCTAIPAGQTFSFPRILTHVYRSLEECYCVKHEYMESHLPDHPVYRELPIIYNHWWAYEDAHIDEETLLKNAALAASLGAELLVLDAGWFGKDSASENWYNVRGDWDLVNHNRFPHGLAYLKKEVEKTGLKFGIWCEIEGLGKNADLALSHPEFAAKRDGKSLSYLCFGNPDVVDWAFETLSALFEKCGSAYWKLDFNLDPGTGCNDTSHHHGSKDGLYRHYEGLYTLLDRLRCAYPDLIIENCSSGGQRMNLEMAAHTHLHFLSDPDYSSHQMRLFKEAGKWFLPKQLLHFMWSNTVTVNGSSPFPGLNLKSLSRQELEYHLRLAMLHPFGISHRLPEYSNKTLTIIKEEITRYKEHIRPFIACGRYLPLYQSETVNIFRFFKDNEQLIFFFAEKAGETFCPVTGLNAFDFYDVYSITQDFLTVCSKDVLNKACFISKSEWFSSIIKIKPHL